jgi:hypothetical protein
LGLIGIAVSVNTLIAYKGKVYQDNERARREFSLNLIQNSENKLGIGKFCVLFLADMSRDEIAKILKFDELDINDAHIDKLTSCLEGKKEDDLLNKSQNPPKLTKNGSYYVNYQGTLQMDELETIASVYYSGIADENIIKRYFDTSLKIQPFWFILTD